MQPDDDGYDPVGGLGRRDLDPPGLGGPALGGGMIFDPFRGGGGPGMGPRFDPPIPGMPNPGLFGGRGGRGGGRGGGFPRGGFGGGAGFGDEFGPPGFNDGGFM